MIENILTFDIMMILLFLCALLGVSTWSAIFLLSFHFKRFDNLLLKSPYFNEAEKINYKELPLSRYKTLMYISLFSFRRMTGKRFNGAQLPELGTNIVVLSYTVSIMSFFGFGNRTGNTHPAFNNVGFFHLIKKKPSK